MSMLLRATAFGLAGIFLAISACGGDDSKTETDNDNVGGINDPEGEDNDLSSSCFAFCDAQAECLGLTDATCRADCDTQVQMLTELDCAAEGAAENDCITKLSCDELMAYASGGRRAHATCGAAARDYFDACTAGESADCTAMCKHQETCNVLAGSVGACEEMCLLRQANLDVTAGKACGDRFVEFVKCLAQASCEDLGTGMPASCAAAERALSEACS
jgi:hypothetical protein